MHKINCIPPIVFEILKFKNPAIWLAENHKRHYCVWFKPKNLHINGLFCCKIQKTLFWGCRWALFSKWDFFQKIQLCQFFNLKRHPNFMKSFRKILWSVLEKTHLPTDIMTYWHTGLLPLHLLPLLNPWLIVKM